jgi:hypothetical protein
MSCISQCAQFSRSQHLRAVLYFNNLDFRFWLNLRLTFCCCVRRWVRLFGTGIRVSRFICVGLILLIIYWFCGFDRCWSDRGHIFLRSTDGKISWSFVAIHDEQVLSIFNGVSFRVKSIEVSVFPRHGFVANNLTVWNKEVHPASASLTHHNCLFGLILAVLPPLNLVLAPVVGVYPVILSLLKTNYSIFNIFFTNVWTL